MDSLDARVSSLIEEDLVPNALRFLGSGRNLSATPVLRGVILKGEKHLDVIRNSFLNNSVFQNSGYIVQKYCKEENYSEKDWYVIKIDEYFDSYLNSGAHPPIEQMSKITYGGGE